MAISEDGRSAVLKAAPKPIERHPIIMRLVRALRSIGKSIATPISARNGIIGVRTNAESPSTTTIRKMTTLRGVPSKKDPSMRFKLDTRRKKVSSAHFFRTIICINNMHFVY